MRRQREETQVLILGDSEKARPLPTTERCPAATCLGHAAGPTECLLLKYNTALPVTRQPLTLEGGQNQNKMYGNIVSTCEDTIACQEWKKVRNCGIRSKTGPGVTSRTL